MIAIQLFDKNDFITEVMLDDEVFFLHFSWNDWRKQWFLAIENAYNDELVSAIAVLPQRPLIEPVRHFDLPLGELIAVRNDDLATIGRDDFVNGNAELIYWSVDDV